MHTILLIYTSYPYAYIKFVISYTLRRRVVTASLRRYGHLLRLEELQALRAFEQLGPKRGWNMGDFNVI